MNLTLRLIYILLISLMVGACSRQQGGIIRYNSDSDPFKAPEQGDTGLFSGEKVECLDPNDCSEAIAKTIVKEGFGQYSSCASFLVAPQVVALASSCLPEKLKKPETSCEDHIVSIFPKTSSSPSAKVECEKVLTASQMLNEIPGPFDRNYTFLKLKEPQERMPYEVSSDGFKENEEVHTWKLTTVARESQQALGGQNIVSIFQKVHCHALYNTYLNPFSLSKTDPMVIISDCDMNLESSGAPLVAEDGSVKGIFSREIPRVVRTSLMERFEIESLSELGYATSFHCIPHIFEDDSTLDEECTKVFSPAEITMAKADFLNESPAHKKVCAHIAELNQDERVLGNGKIKFQVNTEIMKPIGSGDINKYRCDDGNEFDIGRGYLRVMPVPLCFKNARNWREDFRPFYWYKKAKIEFTLPIIKAGVTLDSSLRMKKVWEEIPSNEIETYTYSWSFRVRTLLKEDDYLYTGQTDIELKRFQESASNLNLDDEMTFEEIKHCN